MPLNLMSFNCLQVLGLICHQRCNLRPPDLSSAAFKACLCPPKHPKPAVYRMSFLRSNLYRILSNRMMDTANIKSGLRDWVEAPPPPSADLIMTRHFLPEGGLYIEIPRGGGNVCLSDGESLFIYINSSL
jgi:hypothetical protein